MSLCSLNITISVPVLQQTKELINLKNNKITGSIGSFYDRLFAHKDQR